MTVSRPPENQPAAKVPAPLSQISRAVEPTATVAVLVQAAAASVQRPSAKSASQKRWNSRPHG